MSTIKLIVKFIQAAISALEKAIVKEGQRLSAAEANAARYSEAAITADQEAEASRERIKQANLLLGKLNNLIQE